MNIASYEVFADKMSDAFHHAGLAITDRQMQQFYTFYDQLVTTNEVLNLTALTDVDDVIIKHFVDSLTCYDTQYFAPHSTVIDVGTGGGFPGVPLAIYDSTLEITLFDSLQKRLRFLDSIIYTLSLVHVRTLHGRAEDMSHTEHRAAYDIATSRAVARLQVLAEWTLPYVKRGGYVVALKGAMYEDELQDAKKALQILGGVVREVRPITLPELDDKRAIIYIEKVKETPKKYPRKPKEIKMNPL